MGIITGLTKAYMQAVEAASVVGGVVRDGKLYLKRKDGGEIEAGTVSGVPGPPGSITSSPAGGDLSGTYPNPIVGAKKIDATKITDATITATQVATANKDGAVNVPSMRTLGTGSQQAAAGDHTHSLLQKIKYGVVSHTSTAANTKTKITYANQFPAGFFTSPPNIVLTPDTTVPEAILYWSVCDRTVTGFAVVSARSTTTASNFHYIAIGV